MKNTLRCFRSLGSAQKESLPPSGGNSPPGNTSLPTSCGCVEHSRPQDRAQLMKSFMIGFTFIFPKGMKQIMKHKTQPVEIGVYSWYYLDFQEFLEVLPFGHNAPWLYDLFAKFISSS